MAIVLAIEWLYPWSKLLTGSSDQTTGNAAVGPKRNGSREPERSSTPHQYTELQRKFGSEVLIDEFAIDRPNTLKAAQWKADITGRIVRPDSNYLCIVFHAGGSKVWCSDDCSVGVPGTVTIQPLCRQTTWHSGGVVEFFQLYLPKSHIRDVSQHAFGKDYQDEDILDLIGTHDPALTGPVSAD